MVSSGVASIMPNAQSGRLRPIAITSSKRRSFAPGIPTVAELGRFIARERIKWGEVIRKAGIKL